MKKFEKLKKTIFYINMKNYKQFNYNLKNKIYINFAQNLLNYELFTTKNYSNIFLD